MKNEIEAINRVEQEKQSDNRLHAQLEAPFSSFFFLLYAMLLYLLTYLLTYLRYDKYLLIRQKRVCLSACLPVCLFVCLSSRSSLDGDVSQARYFHIIQDHIRYAMYISTEIRILSRSSALMLCLLA